MAYMEQMHRVLLSAGTHYPWSQTIIEPMHRNKPNITYLLDRKPSIIFA